MYIHSNNEIDKRMNVSKIANNINTMGSHFLTVVVWKVETSPVSDILTSSAAALHLGDECTSVWKTFWHAVGFLEFLFV